ncbi:alpha/beta fold hydrolase [Streptacidiphilus rugosus]|uniref:alpha/beta fold hydrolase n=1 Tax=Streptacidiphilus rugosus TaxID=405783 RepID=UPI0006911492|nr:alpha/beta hydrolase [Streptacidiphilus rugosus]
MEERWTPSGVRLRRAAESPGRWNWLLVPGGPGLGSESLAGLVEACALPGTVWLVDLPGDGSNRGVPAVPPGPFLRWPQALVEALDGLEHVVAVGHSTGGMFLLSVPELAERLAGLALISSAPHAGWRPRFECWAAAHPLPGVDAAAERYAAAPDDRTLRELTLEAAPWNFTPAGLTRGRALLEGLPYCQEAVAWADAHFDADYRASWLPSDLPALIVGGAEDHVVDQSLWQRTEGLTGRRILRHSVAGAGHFPWIDNPGGVRDAFAALVDALRRG